MKFPETTWGYAGKTYAFTLLAAVLCFFLHLSVTMVLSIATTEKIGMRTNGLLEDGRTLVMETLDKTDTASAHRRIFILDADGNETVLEDRDVEDPETDTSEELLKAYPVSQGNTTNIRTETDPGMKNSANWVAQILMGILFLAFPYSSLWYLGEHDRNSVEFGRLAEDKWRGAKIGLLADIPAVLAWGLLILCKLTPLFPSYIVRYRWINVCFWPYFNTFIPGTVLNMAGVTWGAVFAMVPVLLILPLFTGFGYYLGFRDFSIRDRLVYTTTGKRVKRRRKR